MKRSSQGMEDQTASLKWISVSQNRSKVELTVNSEVNRQVFRPTGRNKCNLISVFGAARQGKSFLMNCLAGETELFKISNQRESCTQGIDISHHLIPLSTFSAIHGGRASSSTTNIGFVDAEGQGDRDVTYDANLICPILLVSKAVIFNWKDSMQKDKILNQLGILHKAAINVACEDESLSDESDQKLFGHLHLVFRDWQYEGSDEKSVFNDIFKEERSAETAAAVRNQIRRSVKENFESITVWLFPAPVKDSAQLSTRLSYDITQPSFKQKLGALRAQLSTQLASPSIFDGQPLSGNTIGSIVETIAAVLNTGEAVKPKPAWVSMICSEIEHTRVLFEKNLHQECEKVLAAYGKRCKCVLTTASNASRRLSAGDVSRGECRAAPSGSAARKSFHAPASSKYGAEELITTSFPNWEQAEESLRQVIRTLYTDYRTDVAAIAGEADAGSRPTTLSAEDYAAIDSAVLRSVEAQRAQFASRFAVLCGSWVRAAKEMCLQVLNSECQELQIHTPFVDSELDGAMEAFYKELTQILRDRLTNIEQYITAATTSKPAKKQRAYAEAAAEAIANLKLDGAKADQLDVQETLRNIHQAAELQFQVVRHVNEESKRKAAAACRECLVSAQQRLTSAVDEVIGSLSTHSRGVAKDKLTRKLDEQFKLIHDNLWQDITNLPMGHGVVDDLTKELEKTGETLGAKIESSYSAAAMKYTQRVVQEGKKTIVNNSQHLMDSDEPVTEQHLHALYQELIDKVGEVSVQSLSQWSLSDEQREEWFEEPLRHIATERLQALQFINKKMIDAAQKTAALMARQAEATQKTEAAQRAAAARQAEAERRAEAARQAEAERRAEAERLAEVDRQAEAARRAEATKSRKRMKASVVEEEEEEEEDNTPTPVKSRRGTKKFQSEDDEAQYDMEVDLPRAPAAKSKARRLTKKFKDDEDEMQYDMDVEPEPVAVPSTVAPATGRLPSSGASVAEQKRKAKEWALAQKKAKTPAKATKAPRRAPTPPLPESSEEEEEVVIAPKGRGRGKKSTEAVPTKLTKEEAIQQAKEKARQVIKNRESGRLAQLAVEIEEEEATGRRSSVSRRQSRGDGN